MAGELERVQSQVMSPLSDAVESAASIITKDYLGHLETYEIIRPSEEDIDLDIAACSKFFKLTRLVISKEENFLDKLTTIVNVVSSIDCSLATVVRSDGASISYYLGIIPKSSRTDQLLDQKKRDADTVAFRGALSGNLLGSDLQEVPAQELDTFRRQILQNTHKSYAAVSGIVALRDDQNTSIEGYVQGLENLVDSLTGQTYTIVMIADPVSSNEIQIIKRGYEMLHTQLSTFLRNSMTWNENDSVSVSKSQAMSITEGIAKGISMTQSKTHSKGKFSGKNVNLGINITPFGIGGQIGAGMHRGISSGTSDTYGRTDSTTESSQNSWQTSRSTQRGLSSGKSLQLYYENRSVKTVLDQIDQNLLRLDECSSFGAFDCAAYVIADDRETAVAVASNYNALMRGKNSNVQASHINTWYRPEETKLLGQYLGALTHPRFRSNPTSKVIVTPASIVSGNEIAIQIGLPKKSITGVTVIPMTPFGRNMPSQKRSHVTLGSLHYMGQTMLQSVQIDVQSLSMHTFVTGSTGSGKTTVIYSLLDKLMSTPIADQSSENIKFLVIEPAKGEYKNRFGYRENVHVYGTNPQCTPLLRINPFCFPAQIHVLEHIDRLIEIFNVCWPMYAAMPAVLKDAIERAYLSCGWDMDRSVCQYRDMHARPLYPTFSDVLHQIRLVMNESEYSADSKGDYKGALSTRLKSLTNGLYRQIFTPNALSDDELFEQNVIVDLSRTGSAETKSLIMGFLVMKLQEYRMSGSYGSNLPLRHITVLEEAHHLLKRTSTEQSNESANLLGKSVEMLSNAIAEMRTYGEGFLIADQAPTSLDLSVIRNTNTKIILRLPDASDRALVGRAAGLREEQLAELSRLPTFIAAVYQNDWLEPVLCHIDTAFAEIHTYQPPAYQVLSPSKRELIEFLLLPLNERDSVTREQLDQLQARCFQLNIPSAAKIAFLHYPAAKEKKQAQRLRGQILYEVCHAKNAFQLAENEAQDISGWYDKITELLAADLDALYESERRKAIAILAEEHTVRESSDRATELFNRLMHFL